MNQNIDNKNEIFKHRFREGNDDELVLLISEKDQKAYLPYHYSDLKEIMDKNPDKYHNVQQVIENEYIVNLKNFENSSFARFREAFRLMRVKENKSIFEAFDLALELMFKYELNPIIIRACRNLDELDLYLDCLRKNELEDFNCFQIHFEIMPEKI